MQDAQDRFFGWLSTVPSPPEWPNIGTGAQSLSGTPSVPIGPSALPANPGYMTGLSSTITSKPICAIPTEHAEQTGGSPAPGGKNVLALVTAASDVKAPVLEFQLKATDEDDSTLTCHRVRAYVYNQTVSSQDNLFNDSSMCGGRAHLFDLGVLNLAYHGSSAWSVAKVGQLPPGGVSMVLLDAHGNSARISDPQSSCEVGSPSILGTFCADVSKSYPASTSLRWQVTVPDMPPMLPVSDFFPLLDNFKCTSTAKPALPQLQPTIAKSVPAPSLSYDTTGPTPSDNDQGETLNPEVRMSWYLELAPARPHKPGRQAVTVSAMPRRKLSKRMLNTLRFFADRDNATRTKPRPLLGSQQARDAGNTESLAHSWPGARRSSKAEARQQAIAQAIEHYSSPREVDADDENAKAVMDLFAPLMGQDGHSIETDAFDLADCLANDIMNTPGLVYALS